MSDKLQQRAASVGLAGDQTAARSHGVLGCCTAEHGHPLRLTISDFGPLMPATSFKPERTPERRAADSVYRVADDNGWLLLDLKDLRANASAISNEQRNEIGPRLRQRPSAASIGAQFQRALLKPGQPGRRELFGEPPL